MGRKSRKDTVSLPAIAQLTPKAQRFVQEKACGKTTGQAVLDAGYECKSLKVAQTMGEQLMNKPDVRLALADMISDEFPQMKQLATKALERILRGTTIEIVNLTCPHCQKAFSQEVEALATKDADVLKAIDLLAKICGEYAPKKSMNLTANIETKYKLPED